LQYSLAEYKEIEEAYLWLNRYWNKPARPVYYDAKTVEEAVSILEGYGGEARILAGGIDLVGLMKNEVSAPAVLVNIKNIPSLSVIRENSEGIEIGALTVVGDIEKSALIKDRYSLLWEAARSVGSPQIRNMATLGGNLCQEVRCWYYRRSPRTGISFTCRRKKEGHPCYAVGGENENHAIFGENECFAVCPSDMAVGLSALNARIDTISPRGERSIPIGHFYTSLGHILEPDEMMTRVTIPRIQPNIKQRFLKFRTRKTIDFSIVSVSTAIRLENHVVQDVKIVMGGVAPVPCEAVKAKEVLMGEPLTEDLAEKAAEAAVRNAMPLSKNGYKVPVVKALIKRSILE
jgi:xanthine dehydrogenase YagS FAD-binding subunit